MTYDWFKSEFTAADLQGKSVEFTILDGEKAFNGIGKLKASQDARGYIRVAIDYPQMSHDYVEVMRVFIPVEHASKISKNPPGSKCEFSFHAA